MKKIFLTAILFLFIFSCEMKNSEEIKEKEKKEQKEKKELNFKICLALNPKIESQLGLVTNLFCNADEDESVLQTVAKIYKKYNFSCFLFKKLI